MRNMPPMTLTAERLREVLHYSLDTGEWRWLVTLASAAPAGKKAGSMGQDGYRKIKIDGRHYRGPRLVFLYMIGRWPVDQVDHVDGNPENDRWENLREATTAQNQANTRKHLDSNSRFKGTTNSKYSRRKPYVARIQVDGERIFLGYFSTPEAAHAACGVAAQKYFGEFARLN